MHHGGNIELVSWQTVSCFLVKVQGMNASRLRSEIREYAFIVDGVRYEGAPSFFHFDI